MTDEQREQLARWYEAEAKKVEALTGKRDNSLAKMAAGLRANDPEAIRVAELFQLTEGVG
jgi:phage-related tail protein